MCKSLRFITILFLISFCTYAQEEVNKYKSTEEDAYLISHDWMNIKPYTTSEILNFLLPQIIIYQISDFTPFHGIWGRSQYQDSILNLEIKNPKMPLHLQIEGIPLSSIIKRDSIDNMEVILYDDFFYDEYEMYGEGKAGYWVAIKENNIWKKYYTGLSVYSPLFFKWDSKVKLIKNSHYLQIESALLKCFFNLNNPEFLYDYDLIKDGLITEISIDSLRKDSDYDGLTDIEERKVLLNPYSTDTDNDGINDKADLNPRFKRSYSEITVLYEFIYFAMFSTGFCTDTLIPSDSLMNYNKIIPEDEKNKDTLPYFFVTDSANIQSIYPINHGYTDRKLIVITSNEYIYLKKKYQVLPPFISISPLFKVDDMKDTYKICAGIDNTNYYFLVIKSANKWKIKCIGAGVE